MNAGKYIEEGIGAGFVILTSMMPFYPRGIHMAGKTSSFREIHPALGTMEDFSTLLRGFKKRGIQTVITLDFNAVPVNHEFAKTEFLKKPGSGGEVRLVCLVNAKC